MRSLPPSSVGPRRVRTAGILLVVFLGIVALAIAAGAYFYLKGAIRTPLQIGQPLEPEVPVAQGPSQGTMVLERVEIYRQGPIEIISVSSLPARIHRLMLSQSECFHNLMAASERLQNNGLTADQAQQWNNILADFPEKLYFSKPIGGQSECGPRETIVARYGEQNTHSMSPDLYDTFYSLTMQADPLNLEASLPFIREKLNAELNWIELHKPYQKSTDAQVRAQSMANRTWLQQYRDFLPELEAAQEKLPQDSGGELAANQQQCQEAWRSFNALNARQMDEWFTTTSPSTPYYTASFPYESEGYPVARIPFGGHFLYLTPDISPEEIIFSQEH